MHYVIWDTYCNEFFVLVVFVCRIYLSKDVKWAQVPVDLFHVRVVRHYLLKVTTYIQGWQLKTSLLRIPDKPHLRTHQVNIKFWKYSEINMQFLN